MRRVFAIVTFVAACVLGGSVIAVSEAGAGGGGHGSCFPVPRDGTDEPVIIEGTCYEPVVLYVDPGTTVSWEQRDVIPHNVTLFDGELVGGIASMSEGDTVSRAFPEAGVFPYYCSVHPSMVGVVVVGDPASPAFGASLEVQTSAEDLRAITAYKEEWLTEFQQSVQQPGQEVGVMKAGKGSEVAASTAWGEMAVGLGLAGGLLVGLVAVGGGWRRVRRGR